MKLVWHIFRKDLRRLAVPLALWVVLLVLKYALGWNLITWSGLGPARFGRMINFAYLLVWLEVIANFLLVTRLIHEDAPTGGPSFWMTRPIAGGRLLAAKGFGFAVMFILVPVLIAVPWWLANHYDAQLMSEAMLEQVLAQLAIGLPAVLLASLTDGLGRLLLWLLVAAATSVWWFFVAFANNVADNHDPDGVALTRSCLAFGLIAVVIAGVVTWQFLTRRHARALALTAGGVALVGLVAWGWRWNLLPDWRHDFSGGPPVTTSTGNGGVTFSVVRAKVPDFTDKAPDYVKPDLRMMFAARGLPENSVLIDGPFTNEWRWPDGTRLDRESWGGRGLYIEEVDADVRRRLQLKPSPTIERWLAAQQLTAWRDAVLRERWVRIPSSFAARMHREPPAYTARLNYLLARPEIRFETPARAGALVTFGAASVRPIGPQPPNAPFTPWREVMVVTEPVFVRLALTLARLQPVQTEFDQLQFFVANRRLGDVLQVWGWSGKTVVLGSVRIAWKDFQVSGAWRMSASEQATFVGDGATLLGIGFRDYRYFTQELKQDRFEVTN